MANTAAPVQFNLKHFETVTASMLNYLAGVQALVTDFNIGSVNRTLLEAVAMEIEELYYRLFAAIQASIPEATYLAFGFAQAPATIATGSVTFSRGTPAPTNYLIHAGTLVQTMNGVQFQTVADVTLLSGQTSINASVVAAQAGSTGNVAASSITQLSAQITGIESVTNAAATTGGTDQETDDARAARFAQFVSSLARSPINGILAGALTAKLIDPVTSGVTEQVKGVNLVEPYLTDQTQPVGVATLYIENGSGTASGALVTQCQNVINGYVDGTGKTVMGYKAAGVVITVVAATAVPTNLTMQVTLASGAVFSTVQAALATAAAGIFTGLQIGQSLDWGALFVALRQVAGVQSLTLSVPAGNVTATAGQRLTLGTVTVTHT